MKIYNENIKMNSAKVILSKNPFKLVHNICQHNETIVIAPWTKLAEIFNYKKNNFLANMINEEFEEFASKMLHQPFIIKTIKEIEQKHGFEFLDFDERSAKIIKDHLKVSSEFITTNNIVAIMSYVNRYARMATNIVILGFDTFAIDLIKLNLDKINILLVASSLKDIPLGTTYIETLIIEYGQEELLQIFDTSILKSWLESKTGLALIEKDIKDYFANVINEKTILIEKVIQNM